MTSQLSIKESLRLLKKYNIPVVNSRVANDKESLLKAAGRIGFPVVIKIDSPDIIHKSDAGMVVTDINNKRELEEAYEKIMNNVKAKSPVPHINGVMVSGAASGVEVIVGAKKDRQFGPVVLCGIGGVFVEVLKDISLRVAPIDRNTALEMINELKGKRLLEGVRGMEEVNKKKIADLIVKVSVMIDKETTINEMDFNPVIANNKTAKVADMRILK